jgi:hypothetical protein
LRIFFRIVISNHRLQLCIDALEMGDLFLLSTTIERGGARGGTAAEKRERQFLKRLLPIAAGYDGDCDAAKNAHDYQPITVAHKTAQFRVQELLYKIGELPALTPDGITIKAQAYQACAALGKEERFQATIHLGPSIAEDVCRVLSEGEEA